MGQKVRKKAKLSNEQEEAIVKKMIKSNSETISLLKKADRLSEAETLNGENLVLLGFLPQEISPHEYLEKIREKIKGAQSNGQARGIAMKYLKGNFPNLRFNPVEVQLFINVSRGENLD